MNSGIIENTLLNKKTNLQNLFFETLEHLSYGVILIDTSSGTIIEINRKFLETTGLSKKNTKNKNWISLTHQEDVKLETEKLDLMKEGKKNITFKKRFISKDNLYIWTSVTLIPLKTEEISECFHICLVSDLSNKIIKDKGKKLTIKILKIMNSYDELGIILEKILHEFKKFSGFQAAGIRLIEEDDYPYYTTIGFTDEFVMLENSLCIKDDDDNIIRDSEGNVFLECMCGNIIKGRTDPKFPFFTRGGSFWSNNTSKMLANSSEEDRQARTRNRCNSEGYESVALFPIKSKDNVIGLLQINDRRIGMFNLEMIELFEEMSNSIGIIFERIQREEDLRKAMQQINKSERLAASGRLSASIAHEINNPLQAIYTNMSFVKDNLPENFSEKGAVDIICEGLERIEETVNQLLDINRETVEINKNISVNKTIRSIYRLLEKQLTLKDITVKLKLSNEKLIFDGRQHDFYLVIMNILLNANDAIETNGIIKISTELKNKYIYIHIEDNGCGITKKNINSIFDPFYTTKSELQGTGLGLSTAKNIIEGFDGTLNVTSIPGKQTIFTVVLPEI